MYKLIKIILVIIVLNGCAYEPILLKKNYDFYFSQITYEGEKKINQIVKESFLENTKKNSSNKYQIFFSTVQKKKVIASNKKGDPTIFRLNINLNYLVNFDGVEVLKNSIKKEITYNNIDDKFELFKYEENILESLADNLTDDILISIVSLN